MSINFMIPINFLPRIASGELIRYGAIIKNASSGRIVGHLKEIGDTSSILSSLSYLGSSIIPGTNAVRAHMQLSAIQNTLSSLKMITTTGALASFATLGICITGFAVIKKRIQNLDSKLDSALHELANVSRKIDNLHSKLTSHNIAKLYTAIDLLDSAEHTTDYDRKIQTLKDAERMFHEFRNFYYVLITQQKPLEDNTLNLNQVSELYARFFSCCQGELQANFLLDDYQHWYHKHSKIKEKLSDICRFDKHAILRSRITNKSLIFENDIEQAKYEIRNCLKAILNTKEIIETLDQEIKFVEKKQMDSKTYLMGLKDIDRTDIVLVA